MTITILIKDVEHVAEIIKARLLAQKVVEMNASECEKLPTHTHGECPKTLSEGPIIHI